MDQIKGSINQEQDQPFEEVNPFTDKTVVQRYEAWYANIGRRADHLEKDLLKKLLDQFPEAHSLLEIGCGTAHFTRWFETQGLQVLGLDSSRPMLEEAKSLGNPFCLLADALKLPLATNSFDLTAMITTLEFIPDPLRGLTEALRVSRQGLILGVLNRRSILGRRINDDQSTAGYAANLFTPNELVRLVKQVVGGDQFKISWKTTLWPLTPFSLPLPWGGFIGMSVRITYIKNRRQRCR